MRIRNTIVSSLASMRFLRGSMLSLVAATALGSALPVQAEEVVSNIARGGMLYDKWYLVLDQGKPKTSHPAYPKEGKQADNPGNNWRCKECHGWDTLGRDGAYAGGSHYTGIKGIQGMRKATTGEVIAVLKDDNHLFGDKMSSGDLLDLALFVSQGQVDMDQYIDRKTKAPKGDAARGEVYYNTVCAKCHDRNGFSPKEMKPLGSQMGNPWEVMHKILNGQPDAEMPALRAFDHQIIADIMAHLATLPKERH